MSSLYAFGRRPAETKVTQEKPKMKSRSGQREVRLALVRDVHRGLMLEGLSETDATSYVAVTTEATIQTINSWLTGSTSPRGKRLPVLVDMFNECAKKHFSHEYSLTLSEEVAAGRRVTRYWLVRHGHKPTPSSRYEKIKPVYPENPRKIWMPKKQQKEVKEDHALKEAQRALSNIEYDRGWLRGSTVGLVVGTVFGGGLVALLAVVVFRIAEF